MPAVKPPSTILVTAATGFIATWLVRTLLERGFAVRGTVRTDAKGKYLENLFKSYGDKFSYLVVLDAFKDGAFDDAVKGVDGVIHAAGLAKMDAVDPDEVIVPAVNGIRGLLTSAKKHGDKVKRVVMLSSGAAIVEPHDGVYTYTEEDWNNWAVNEVKRIGSALNGVDKYRASTVLAERAAWDFFKENQVGFDLTAILPPVIFGPVICECASVEQVNWSSSILYGAIKNEIPPDIANVYSGFNWADVRDVAKVHVASLETEAAGGQRIIAAGGPFAWQDAYDALNTEPAIPGIPKGQPGAAKDFKHPVLYSTEKAKKLFPELKFHTLEECMKDSVKSYKERGW